MRRRTFLASTAACAVVAALPACRRMTHRTAVADMVAGLDPANHDDADVVANCLHALALIGEPTATVSDRLWELRETWSGHSGWGLTVAWDAFSDGSENPADTIYGYTTGRAGLAFHAAGDTGRASEAAATLACPALWDGSGVDYSNQTADRGYRVWNIDGLALWLWSDLGVYPSERVAIQSNLEAAQGEGVSVPSWHWPYQDGSNTKNDCHHLAFIIRGLQRAGSSSLSSTWANLHRFHAGAGKTKMHDSSSSAVTSGRDPGWHCALATWGGLSWADAVADDLVASSYRRDTGVHGDRDVAHSAYGLAEYVAAA